MKKALKRILSVILCMLVATGAMGISVVTGADTLTLDENAVFIDGYPDKTFLPDKTMTRAEAIKVVSVAAGYTADFDASSVKTAFTDMADSEWYVPNVKYLEKYDILDFYGTKLDAGKGITRGEFVKLISGFVTTESGSKSFPDVPTSHPYYNEIIKAANAGIVKGNPDGTFAPDATLTRAEIVTIIDRLLGRNIVDSNTRKVAKFTDIAGHWAQEEVIAASCTATYNDIIVWYTGNTYASNSPVDKTTLDYSLTEAILSGIDANDHEAVEKAINAQKDKRIAEIHNTPTTLTAQEGKKSYYVSEDGNDSNDGLSPEKAWKTLEKVSNATLKAGDIVYFKRGDTFRGQLLTKYGVTYSAYGEGAKPNLYGSKRNYADEEFWEPSGTRNVWVSKETFENDVGNIVFNHGEAWTTKKAAGINGTIVVRDLDMHHNTEDKKLYLYSKTDPNTRFESAEICEHPPVVTGNGTNVTIDNLCLMHSGTSGVDYSSGQPSNLTVQNCIMAWNGGSLMGGDDIVRLGNGAGTFNTAKNQSVINCHIYQVYDSGITYQWFNATTGMNVEMSGIKYLDNVIEYATWGIEYINAQPEAYGVMKDIEFSGNIIAYAGDGWGNQRPDRNGSHFALINGWGGTNHAKNFLIYDNVFIQPNTKEFSLFMWVHDAKNIPEITGNIFAGTKGGLFAVYGAGEKNRFDDAIPFDETITEKTIGLDDNTFIFLK